MQLTTSITSLLSEWGKWSNSGLGLTLNSEPSLTFYDIDDDVALEIDKAIALLGSSKPRTKTIIMMYYRNEHSIRTISSRLGIGKSKVSLLLSSGEAWLDGHLLAKGILIQNAA